MDAQAKFFALLSRHGAVEQPHTKHRKFLFPDGRTFAVAGTPSDAYHGWKNALSDLRHFLGLVTEPKAPVCRPKRFRNKGSRTKQPVRLQPVPEIPYAGLRGQLEKIMDVHKATAAELFDVPVEQVTKEQRTAAKTINFAAFMNATGVKKPRWA